MQLRKTGDSLWKLAAASLAVSVLAFVVSADPLSVAQASPQKVEGEYIEARTCDVWTGPCFANGEINLRGDKAVMGWAVRTGTFNGVRLDGLKVAASIDAEGTLGTGAEGKARAVVYVDRRANEAQGEALVELAKALAGEYLRNIVKVHTGEEISFSREGSRVEFRVGNDVEIRTKALSMHCDVICGNEEQAYPTLASTLAAECAKTVSHAYRGSALGSRWSDPGARSAIIGSFSLPHQNLVDASR